MGAAGRRAPGGGVAGLHVLLRGGASVSRTTSVIVGRPWRVVAVSIRLSAQRTTRSETTGGSLFTVPVEGVFSAHPAVLRTALVGVPRDGQPVPVLCVERDPEAAQLPEEQLRRELLELGAKYAHTRSVTTILFHPKFPVDIRHNAKIFREKLAAWAAGRLA